MDPGFAGAPPGTAVFDQILAEEPDSSLLHRNTFSGDSFSIPDTFEDVLNFDLEQFDFDILNSPPPSPTLPPTVTVDSASSVELKAQASEVGPVGPTAGLDLGGERKGKRRLRNSYTVGAYGPLVSRGKRTMNSEELAELARVDPKRVKRILCNRKSAAKSKERRVIYEKDLREKVPQLAIQSANLDAKLRFLAEDTTNRDVRLKQLRLTIDAMRQEAQIKDAVSASVKEELRSLRRNKHGHVGVMSSCGSVDELTSQFSSQLALQKFHNHPSSSQKHLDLPQQTQLFMPNPLPYSTTQSFSGQYGPNNNFSNFNQQN
ncbi:Transcription factor RF2b [Glycine soja]